MTEPTDLEITQLWNEQQGRYPDPIPFARAILAKFGTPPAVAGEPEGWITWWPTAPGVHKPVYSHGPNKPSHGPALDSRLRKYPVFTPQPTQAQAGAVPLTDEQIDAAAKKLAECMEYPWEFMPEPGRKNMRKHAQDVIGAAYPLRGKQ